MLTLNLRRKILESSKLTKKLVRVGYIVIGTKVWRSEIKVTKSYILHTTIRMRKKFLQPPDMEHCWST